MCEVDQSPSLRVKTKTKWNYNTAPPTCLHGVDRTKFTFYIEEGPRKSREN